MNFHATGPEFHDVPRSPAASRDPAEITLDEIPVRLLWLFIGLVALVLVPFFLWGDALEAMFTQAGTVSVLQSYGTWAWAMGVGLLSVDLLLPIPGTVVMAALGYVYGPFVGGLVAGLGSVLAGSIGYLLCRYAGRGAATWLVGEEELERGEWLFASVGGWLVVLSRWLPVFPEVIACMAGLARMPMGRFHLALACGSLPLGFVFAAIGHTGAEYPTLAVVLSAGIPLLLWVFVRPIFRAKASRDV